MSKKKKLLMRACNFSTYSDEVIDRKMYKCPWHFHLSKLLSESFEK